MSKLSITIISLNYAPEDTAIGLYSSQMAEYLVEQGWQVQVICGFPYYPKWEIKADYKKRPKYLKETINGVEVFRYKQFVPKNPTFKARTIQIVDFTLGNLMNLNKIKKADIVLSVIPFTSSAWLGNRLAKKINAKHWIHIQDFEFDAAFESGLSSRNGWMKNVASSLFRLEKSILEKADLISTISFGMLRQLETKTNKSNYYFPNWVDETFINPAHYSYHPFMNKDKFNILYSGNIGGKQDWNLFVKVLKEFESSDYVEFIIVGDGGSKSELVSALESQKNVTFYEPVAYKELNNLLCSADLHLLFQKQDVVDTVMPSKILGMMASGKPSLVTGNKESEVKLAFDKSNGGVFVDNGSVNDIANAINGYISNPEQVKTHGEKARTYVTQNFTSEKILGNFAQRITQLVKNK